MLIGFTKSDQAVDRIADQPGPRTRCQPILTARGKRGLAPRQTRFSRSKSATSAVP